MKPISILTFCHALLSVSDKSCVNSIVFDMLILACVDNGKVELSLEGFRRAGDYGFKLSVVSCNSMLSELVEGKIGNVEFLYKEMIRRRVAFNSITLNTVVSGLCKAGKLNKAGDVVEDMKVYGVVPTVITYNTLIDGNCERGGPGRRIILGCTRCGIHLGAPRHNQNNKKYLTCGTHLHTHFLLFYCCVLVHLSGSHTGCTQNFFLGVCIKLTRY